MRHDVADMISPTEATPSADPATSVDDGVTEYFAFSTFLAACSRAKELAMHCGVPLLVRRKDARWSVVVEPQYWATFSEALGHSVMKDAEWRERRGESQLVSYEDDPEQALDGIEEYWPGWL